MDRITPATALLQPSRPTTATTTSPAVEPPSAYRFTGPGSPSATVTANTNSPPFESPSSFAPLPNLLPLFAKYPVRRPNRGTVRIRVEATHFYVHREVLILASPFFESVITGGWKETEPRRPRQAPAAGSGASTSPSTTPQPTPDAHPQAQAQAQAEARTSIDHDPDRAPAAPVPTDGDDQHKPHLARPPSPPASLSASYISSIVDDDEDGQSDDDGDDEGEELVVCRLRLVEENALSFQALLCHLYPRLECLISWNNVGDLCRMASKLDLPSLRNACIAFLLPSAAGKPVEGMRIAEEMNMCVLFRPSSPSALT